LVILGRGHFVVAETEEFRLKVKVNVRKGLLSSFRNEAQKQVIRCEGARGWDGVIVFKTFREAEAFDTERKSQFGSSKFKGKQRTEVESCVLICGAIFTERRSRVVSISVSYSEVPDSNLGPDICCRN
jgi:hypothetical protein